MDELSYSLAFSYLNGVGPATFNILKSKFHSAKKAYLANRSELVTVVKPTIAEKIILHRNTFNIEKELNMMRKSGILVISQEDSRYPKQLLNLFDPPICLYIKGNISAYNFEEDMYFAIVGTRKPTFYGEMVATKFAYELAKKGFVIVSGMALGIDAIAHTAALDAECRTIAFLGCGVNVVYPPSNRLLYKRILDNNGLIISEIPPNRSVLPGLFVQRNRLISGLSQGIMVAEGLKDSGSLITAKFAAQQGKDVFAPPAPINSELSEAPNILLKEGAKLVTTVNDILEEYGMSPTSQNIEEVLKSLSAEEKQIYILLSRQPYDCDELARQVQIPIYKLLTMLSALEMKDIIVKKGSLYGLK